METTGKVIAILPLRSGISKNGKEWKSQDGSYRQQPPKSAPVPHQPNMFPPQQSNADGNDDLPF